MLSTKNVRYGPKTSKDRLQLADDMFDFLTGKIPTPIQLLIDDATSRNLQSVYNVDVKTLTILDRSKVFGFAPRSTGLVALAQPSVLSEVQDEVEFRFGDEKGTRKAINPQKFSVLHTFTWDSQEMAIFFDQWDKFLCALENVTITSDNSVHVNGITTGHEFFMYVELLKWEYSMTPMLLSEKAAKYGLILAKREISLLTMKAILFCDYEVEDTEMMPKPYVSGFTVIDRIRLHLPNSGWTVIPRPYLKNESDSHVRTQDLGIALQL